MDKAPTPPTAEELKEAELKAQEFLKQAEVHVEAAEALADKFGFELTWHKIDKDYMPAHTDDSMWAPSSYDDNDDYVEGTGNLDFSWTQSNEGNWLSSSDRCY